jgi:hypothetical protein
LSFSSCTLQLVVHRDDTEDAFRGLLGLPLLAQTADGSAEGDSAVVGRDGDPGTVELGIPEQLCVNIPHEVVARHR